MLRIRVAARVAEALFSRVGVLDGEESTELKGQDHVGEAPALHTGRVVRREVKPRLGGEAVLVRYCDDFVIGFERREDAQRVAEVLGKRMERFGLRLHPEKTRLIAFERPEAGQRGGKGPGTFEFLGFTMYWRRTRSGRWQMWCKTRSKGLWRFNRTRRRMVPAPPASTGQGPARSAQETLARTLQLLRSERQHPKLGSGGARHATGLVHQLRRRASDIVGAVQPITGTLPASPPIELQCGYGEDSPDTSAEGGWWQSPCPVLVRASGE